MEEVNLIDLKEFIEKVKPQEAYNDTVIVMDIDGSQQKEIPSGIFPQRFNAYSVFLACRGEASVTMDYIPYVLQQNMVLERGHIHVMNDMRMSHNFRGYHIVLSEQIIRNLVKDIIMTVPKQYPQWKRANPVQKLDNKDFDRLVEIIERLRANIRRKDHFFQKTIVLNEAHTFLMELANISMQKVKGEKQTLEIGHYEELALNFAKLLATNCRKWNEVSDYSTELCVTPIYLSRTVKQLSGKSALEWITHARLSEAKILLRKRSNTVQDVAEMLNFSDQSAFGKFFKKQEGVSPIEYKRMMLQEES